MNRRLRGLLYTVPGLVLGAAGAASCRSSTSVEGDPPQVDWTCGLACPAHGVADGNASISGDPNVDRFFRSVLHFQASAVAVSSGIRAELDAIGRSVGAKAGDDADIRAKLEARLAASVPGGLTVSYQPPRCSARARPILDSEARCDDSVDPPYASIQCEGTCTPDVGAPVDCGADATLSCTGPAPGSICTGTCRGECQLDAPAKCAGTCRGTCTGSCSIKDAAGACTGSCDGTCQGSCTLAAPAKCDGSCRGECTWSPSSGKCDATARAHCDAGANGPVDCRGTCSGKMTPPTARGECEASATADMSVDATCTPPALDVSYQLAAGVAGDALAAGEFQAWLEGFKGHVSAILAYEARSEALGSAATDIASHGRFAIKDSIEGSLKTRDDLLLAAMIGLGCAPGELPHAITLVEKVGTDLAASDQAVVDVLGMVGVI